MWVHFSRTEQLSEQLKFAKVCHVHCNSRRKCHCDAFRLLLILEQVASMGLWHRKQKQTSKECHTQAQGHANDRTQTRVIDRETHFLMSVKRLLMKKHATRTAEAHHCASFAPSSEAPPADHHNKNHDDSNNNDNNNNNDKNNNNNNNNNY